MRPAAYAALSLTIIALAGCDGNGDADAPAWAGPPDPAEDGSASFEEFAAYQDDVDERWERAAETAAAEFVRLDESDVARVTIARAASGEGEGPQTVLVTLDGLFDDSVRAERWALLFEPEGETFTLTDARWAQRCQPGRGHQAFTAEPCA
ncbi:MAG: hypothetical protein ACRELC_02975 [Gemmatimonadota bacterium]